MVDSSFTIPGRTISLRIGSLFDSECEALMMTPAVLAAAAEYFGRSVRRRYVLGETYYEFRPIDDTAPIEDELEDSFLEDPRLFLRSLVEPVAIGCLVAVCASSSLLAPSLLRLDDKALVLVALESLLNAAREGVVDDVTKILQLCDTHNVSSIAILPFGQNHPSEPEKGMVDAIVAWTSTQPTLVEIVSPNATDETTTFKSLKDAIVELVGASTSI